MDKFAELERCVASIEKDANKFFSNGNKAAGTRARKHLQELKQLSQDLRVLIQETKNDKSGTAAPLDAHGAYDGVDGVDGDDVGYKGAVTF